MKVREIALCALFIALVAVGAFIRIPVGTDVYTLQFLFTLLAGVLLGARLGAVAVGVYVLMGLVGIPVFASGGGPSYVLQPTFGYLVGFICQAYLTGALVRGGRPSGACSARASRAWRSSICSAFPTSTSRRTTSSMRPSRCGSRSGTAAFCRSCRTFCCASPPHSSAFAAARRDFGSEMHRRMLSLQRRKFSWEKHCSSRERERTSARRM